MGETKDGRQLACPSPLSPSPSASATRSLLLWSYCAYTPQAASCSLLTPAGVLQVKTDKQREVDNGHDGTWVAHPALVTLALEIFNASMPSANQIPKSRSDVQVGLPLVATFP